MVISQPVMLGGVLMTVAVAVLAVVPVAFPSSGSQTTWTSSPLMNRVEERVPVVAPVTT